MRGGGWLSRHNSCYCLSCTSSSGSRCCISCMKLRRKAHKQGKNAVFLFSCSSSLRRTSLFQSVVENPCVSTVSSSSWNKARDSFLSATTCPVFLSGGEIIRLDGYHAWRKWRNISINKASEGAASSVSAMYITSRCRSRGSSISNVHDGYTPHGGGTSDHLHHRQKATTSPPPLPPPLFLHPFLSSSSSSSSPPPTSSTLPPPPWLATPRSTSPSDLLHQRGQRQAVRALVKYRRRASRCPSITELTTSSATSSLQGSLFTLSSDACAFCDQLDSAVKASPPLPSRLTLDDAQQSLAKEEAFLCRDCLFHPLHFSPSLASPNGSHSAAAISGRLHHLRQQRYGGGGGPPAAIATTACSPPPPPDALFPKPIPDVSYRVLMTQYIEGILTLGSAPPTRLLYHLDAPAPAEVLEEILHHVSPTLCCVACILDAIIRGYRPSRFSTRIPHSPSPGPTPHSPITTGEGVEKRGGGGWSSGDVGARAALCRAVEKLRQYCASLYHHPEVQPLLLKALLAEGLVEEAVGFLTYLTPVERTRVLSVPEVWEALMKAAAQQPLPDPNLLSELLSPVMWEEDNETEDRERLGSIEVPDGREEKAAQNVDDVEGKEEAGKSNAKGEKQKRKRTTLPPVFPSYCRLLWKDQETPSTTRNTSPLISSFLSTFSSSSSSSGVNQNEKNDAMRTEGSREGGMMGAGRGGGEPSHTQGSHGGQEMPSSSSFGCAQMFCLSSGQWRYELEHHAWVRREFTRSALPLFSSLSHLMFLQRFSPVNAKETLLPRPSTLSNNNDQNNNTASSSCRQETTLPTCTTTATTETPPLSSSVSLLERAIAVQLRATAHALLYGVTVSAATQLLLCTGTGFGGLASPPLAQRIVQRYLDTCAAQKQILQAVEYQVDAEFTAIRDFCHHHYYYYYDYYNRDDHPGPLPLPMRSTEVWKKQKKVGEQQEQPHRRGEGGNNGGVVVLTTLFSPSQTTLSSSSCTEAAFFVEPPAPRWLAPPHTGAEAANRIPRFSGSPPPYESVVTRSSSLKPWGVLCWPPFAGPWSNKWLFLSPSSFSLLSARGRSMGIMGGRKGSMFPNNTYTPNNNATLPDGNSFLLSLWDGQPSAFYLEGQSTTSLTLCSTLPHPSVFLIFIRILRGARDVLTRDRQTAFINKAGLSTLLDRHEETEAEGESRNREKLDFHQQDHQKETKTGSKAKDEDHNDEEEEDEGKMALTNEKLTAMALDNISDPVLFYSMLYSSVMNVVKWEVAWKTFQALNRENSRWLHPYYRTALWITTCSPHVVRVSSLKRERNSMGAMQFVVVAAPHRGVPPGAAPQANRPQSGGTGMAIGKEEEEGCLFFVSPEDSEEGARDVLDIVCRGADPWMSLNIARAAVRHHVMDGLEAALWVVHRLDPSHHVEEAREVSRLLFYWLLADAGIHLQPELHVHLIPLARVLIRLQLLSALRHLYNIFVDYHYLFSPHIRSAFMQVMRDLVCPECSSLLAVEEKESASLTASLLGEKKEGEEANKTQVLGQIVALDEGASDSSGRQRDASSSSLIGTLMAPTPLSSNLLSLSSLTPAAQIYFDRRCRNCMAVVPAKNPLDGSLPSFALSTEHIHRIRAGRRSSTQEIRNRLQEKVRGMSAQRVGRGEGEGRLPGPLSLSLPEEEKMLPGSPSGEDPLHCHPSPPHYYGGSSPRRQFPPLDPADRLRECVLEGEDEKHYQRKRGRPGGWRRNEREHLQILEHLSPAQSSVLLLPGVPFGFMKELFPRQHVCIKDGANKMQNDDVSSSLAWMDSRGRGERGEGNQERYRSNFATMTNNNNNNNGPMWLAHDKMEPQDIRQAMQESRKRLALHRALREKAWATKGGGGWRRRMEGGREEKGSLNSSPSSLSIWDSHATHALMIGASSSPSLPPLPLPHSLFSDSSSLSGRAQEAVDRLPAERVRGPWVCVWCRASHGETSSRKHCKDCGAETGPSASWRRRAGPGGNGRQVMQVIRSSIRSAVECHHLQEAVVSCYLLMVYRRTFLIQAVAPYDYELLHSLLEIFIFHQEKVFAGYIFTRFIFPQDRLSSSVRRLWFSLADLFHTNELLEEEEEEGDVGKGNWGGKMFGSGGTSPSLSLDASGGTATTVCRIPNTSSTSTPTPTSSSYRASLEALSDEDVMNDDVLFPILFSPETCTLCFGAHPVNRCPILTRQFHPREGEEREGECGKTHGSFSSSFSSCSSIPRTAPLQVSDTEKMKAAFHHLRQRIALAYRTVKDEERVFELRKQKEEKEKKTETAPPQTGAKITVAMATIVRAAYTTFMISPFRSLFALQYPHWTNRLSILLSRLREHRRASFVLCHIPYPFRDNRAYQLVLPYYQVEEEESVVKHLLLPRPPPPPTLPPFTSPPPSWWTCFHTWMNYSHPSFMQVTKTCCMCLDERHASYCCPRLQQWKEDVLAFREFSSCRGPSKSGQKREEKRKESCFSPSSSSASPSRSQLLAQVSGWVHAGPERLNSFCRFLLEELTTHKGEILRRKTVAAGNRIEHYYSNFSSSSSSLSCASPERQENHNGRIGTQGRFQPSSQKMGRQEEPSTAALGGAGNLVDVDDPFVVALQQTIQTLLRSATPTSLPFSPTAPDAASSSSLLLSAFSQSSSPQSDALISAAAALFAHTPTPLLSTETVLTMLSLGNAKYSTETAQRLLHIKEENGVEGGEEEDGGPATCAGIYAHRASSSAGAAAGHHREGSPPRRPSLLHLTEAAAAAVPLAEHCLFCFRHFPRDLSSSTITACPPHAFLDCPIHWKNATLAQRIRRLCELVGQIAISFPEGPRSAALAILSLHDYGMLSTRWLRPDRDGGQAGLIRPIWELALRCFAGNELRAGVRLLRLLPLELVPPEVVYPALWKAAGVPAEEVEERTLGLVSLYDAEGIVPPSSGSTRSHASSRSTTTAVTTSSTATTTRGASTPCFSSFFHSQWRKIVFEGLCPHCFEVGHDSSHFPNCTLFQEELHFGRDFVAAYRMSMVTNDLDRRWQDGYMVELIRFFATHRAFFPYHITGVCGALHAMIAMLCFRGEGGIAAQMLLWIPPAYRRLQAYRYILHSLKVPSGDIARALHRLRHATPSSTPSFFSPPHSSSFSSMQESDGKESSSPSSSHRDEEDTTRDSRSIPYPPLHPHQTESGGGSSRHTNMVPTNYSPTTSGPFSVTSPFLYDPKVPFRDAAMRSVFEPIPIALAALSNCGKRIHLFAGCGSIFSSVSSASSGSASPSPSSSSSCLSSNPKKDDEGKYADAHPFPAQTTSTAITTSQPPLEQPSEDGLPLSFSRCQQLGSIRQLREDFAALLSKLEDILGMNIGSHHALFQNAVEVMTLPDSPAASPFPTSSRSSEKGNVCSFLNNNVTLTTTTTTATIPIENGAKGGTTRSTASRREVIEDEHHHLHHNHKKKRGCEKAEDEGGRNATRNPGKRIAVEAIPSRADSSLRNGRLSLAHDDEWSERVQRSSRASSPRLESPPGMKSTHQGRRGRTGQGALPATSSSNGSSPSSSSEKTRVFHEGNARGGRERFSHFGPREARGEHYGNKP